VGHEVSTEGIQPDKRNVEKIQQLPSPTNLKELRGFLEMAQYYRKFIQDFSKLARLLFELLKNDTPWE